MSQFWNLVVFSVLLSLSNCLDKGAVLQLGSCALQNVITDILTNKDTLDKMAKSPAAKKALGKKGASPVKGISNIKVEDLKFTEISLDLLPGKGIRMSVTNKIYITGKSFLGGKTEMRMEVNIVTYTDLAYDNSSCPKFVSSECQTNLIDVKANLPKGILPNVMNNFLDKNLKVLLPATLCPSVDIILLFVNEKLCMKKVPSSIGKVGSLQFLVSHLPTVTEEHIEMELNVTVKHGDFTIQPRNSEEDFINPSESTNYPSEISEDERVDPTESIDGDIIHPSEIYEDDLIRPTESSEGEFTHPAESYKSDFVRPSQSPKDHAALPSVHGETALLLSADFLGCAFTALQQEGAFNLNATESELADAGAMSTTVLSEKIPEFPTELQDVKINIGVDEPTMVTLDSSKALLHIYSNFEVTASPLPDTEPQSLFVIRLHMNFRIQFSADDKTLHSDVSLDKIFPSLVSSSLSSLDVEDLKEFIVSVLQEIYTPAINNVLQSAIQLPEMLSMLSIDLTNAHVQIEKNFLVISVNVCKA